MKTRVRWGSRLTLATLATSGLLAACGGGDGPPPVTVPTGARVVAASAGSDLDVNNYGTRSVALVRAVASAVGNTALAGAVDAPREHAQAVSRTATGAASPWVVTALAQQALRSVNLRERAQAVSGPETVFCPGGGTISVTGVDANDSNTVDAGDSIGFVATDCVVQAGLPAASGRFDMLMEAVDIAGDVLQGMQVLVTAGNFSMAGYGTMNGGARLWASGLSGSSAIIRMSYLTTVVTQGAQNVGYEFDIYLAANSGVPSFEISGGITVEGQTYAIELGNAFVNSPPTTGALRLKDAAGDAVRLVAKPGSFDLEFYGSAAPGTLVSITPNQLWANYQL